MTTRNDKRWNLEITQNGNRLQWTLFEVVNGIWSPVDGFTAATVPDLFRDASTALKLELPETFQ